MSVSFSSNNHFDPRNCVAIIHEGPLEKEVSLVEEIRKHAASGKVITVNQAVHYCALNKITPNLSVLGVAKGGPDSLPKSLDLTISVNKYPYDLTDLEFAIQRSIEKYPQQKIVIYGTLGNIRTDYKINNLFLLLKNAGRMLLKSDNESVFALNSEMGDYTLNIADFKTIGFFPISGTAKNLTITGHSTENWSVLENAVKLFHTNKATRVTLNLGEGEVIGCLDRRDSYTSNFSQRTFKPEKSLFPNDLIKLVDCLFQLSVVESFEAIETEKETILSVGKSVSHIYCEIGKSISFFPFPDAVSGVETSGLLWGFGTDSPNTLTKNTLSIGNVAAERNPSISVAIGKVLCIYNANIDKAQLLNDPIRKMIEDNQLNPKYHKNQTSPSFISTKNSLSSQSMEDISLNPLSSRTNSGGLSTYPIRIENSNNINNSSNSN